ncbi:MAG: hypothetical protein P8Y53_18820 [Pseudolabrys sp.]
MGGTIRRCSRTPSASSRSPPPRSRIASTLTGLVTILIGIVSSTTVALGAAGYIGEFVALPPTLIVVALLAVLGAVPATE